MKYIQVSVLSTELILIYFIWKLKRYIPDMISASIFQIFKGCFVRGYRKRLMKRCID